MKFITKKVLYGCEARGDAQSPYLTRYTLLTTRFGSLSLHVFHRSDHDVLHDHPWNFTSLILWRGYNEVTPQGVKRVWPGQLLYRPASWRHRVQLHAAPCERCMGSGGGWLLQPCPDCHGAGDFPKTAVTLVWKSRRLREWGFFTKAGWQDWRTYFREKGC